MDITVASVKRKGAGNNVLQNLMAGLKGTTVNLFIQPIAVERAGNEAMLNFGLALALEAPAFTFPRAKNLTAGGVTGVTYGRPVEEGIAGTEPDPLRQASVKRD